MTGLRRVIALDGPAASGKGTLARLIARHYGLPHLDTGLTYRASAKALLDKGLPLDDEATAVAVARTLSLDDLDPAILSSHAIGEAASRIAVLPAVRAALVEAQRRFAARPGGAVLDGRDIGTVVCPDAAVKLFVMADLTARAQRRHEDILKSGGSISLQTVLDDLKRRDARDMGRTDSPLQPAEDAHLLDTTEMSIDTAFQTARDLIDRVFDPPERN